MRRPHLRVLLIDDSRADARLFEAQLQQAWDENIDIVHVTTGAEGLKILQKETFDCIFLDYMLEISGLDVLCAIRERGDDRPIIAISGSGCEEVAVAALKFGAQEYLVKGSITAEAIRRSITNAIEKVEANRRQSAQHCELRDFACVAAHDLQAPLRRISKYCGEILTGKAGALPQRVEENVEAIQGSAERMNNLLKSLLEFSLAGRSQDSFASIDLQQLVKSVVHDLESDIQARNAVVMVDRLPTVVGHAPSLVQLFQNLISNGIKFCREPKPLVEIGTVGDPDDTWLFVADNGIGIAEDDLNDVFTPFRRFHDPREYSGTGLGLATCKRVVEHHGGQISVESSASSGTTFTFSLPSGPPRSRGKARSLDREKSTHSIHLDGSAVTRIANGARCHPGQPGFFRHA